MIVFPYASKKELKASIGQYLNYIETSQFKAEYVSTGEILGANRPHITGLGREFYATVVLKDGIIVSVK